MKKLFFSIQFVVGWLFSWYHWLRYPSLPKIDLEDETRVLKYSTKLRGDDREKFFSDVNKIRRRYRLKKKMPLPRVPVLKLIHD